MGFIPRVYELGVAFQTLDFSKLNTLISFDRGERSLRFNCLNKFYRVFRGCRWQRCGEIYANFFYYNVV
jgi:hypothetical protein